MCVNYKPSKKETVAALTGADTSNTPDWPEEVWQDYAAPVVRAGEHGEPELIVGTFAMIPKRKNPPGVMRTTMNARAETIGELRSYSKQWRLAQTCLLPMECFYEPNYESGKAERWAIGMVDGEPFCVAGLWRAWEEEEGGFTFSFTQITINANEHPLMKRFHKPDDEKRSLVIIPRAEYDGWLNAGSPEVARAMLANYPAELMKAWPAAKGFERREKNKQNGSNSGGASENLNLFP